MKPATIRVAILLILLLVGGAIVSAMERPEQQRLRKKEAKALLVNAKTPADHLRLAEYYRREARQSEAIARDYVRSQRYKHIAERARRSAENANRMAAQHEEMAANLQKLQ